MSSRDRVQRPTGAHDHLPSEREQEAMAILYEEGWSTGELAMVFEIKHQTAAGYVRDQGVEL